MSLHAWGVRFVSRLTADDWLALRRARDTFHASSFVPLLLYHAFDENAKFPATISYSIRKGFPRLAHHAIWLAGWAQMAAIIRRRGDSVTRLFAAQMLATGVVAVICCPLGRGRLSDKIHFIASGLYMVDHHVLLSLFQIRWRCVSVCPWVKTFQSSMLDLPFLYECDMLLFPVGTAWRSTHRSLDLPWRFDGVTCLPSLVVSRRTRTRWTRRSSVTTTEKIKPGLDSGAGRYCTALYCTVLY